MATKMFLRASKDNAISTYRDMLLTAGTQATDNIQTRTTSGTGKQIQLTATTDGELLAWITGRSPSGGWTFAGQCTLSLWCRQASSGSNCALRIIATKRASDGTETAIGTFDAGVELTTALDEKIVLFTPTSTALAEDDRLLIKVYVYDFGGSMGSNAATITGRYDGADGATGDSFFTITETITFKAEGGGSSTHRFFHIV